MALGTLHEPKEGWTVRSFHYYTVYDESGVYHSTPACIFLASDAAGQNRGLQWWYGKQAPTPFHGEWEMGESALVVYFNCKGPSNDDGSAIRLKRAVLQRRPPSQGHSVQYYEGHDECGRRVKMVPYGTFVVRMQRGHLVWCDATTDVQDVGCAKRARAV